MNDSALFFELFDIVRVIEANAAVFQSMKVAIVGMLVEGDEGVSFVSGMEDFTGTEVDLEDGRAAGNGARNRHVGHDVLCG